MFRPTISPISRGRSSRSASTSSNFRTAFYIEELKSYKKRIKLKESTPTAVIEMMNGYGMLPDYFKLVDQVTCAGVGSDSSSWDIEQLKGLMDRYQPIFAEAGIDLCVSHK
jgi:hypothetical protein